MNIKSIKEFFRPTKVKILILVSFIVLFLSQMIFNFSTFCIRYPSPTLIIFDILLKYLYRNDFIYAIFLIVYYLLSCLIVYFYNYFERSKHGFIGLIFTAGIILILFIPISANNVCVPPLSKLIKSEIEYNYWYFEGRCNELCEDKNLIGYCTYYFGKNKSGITDLNEDNQKNSLVLVGAQNWPACESRIYCFLTVPCKKLGSTQSEVMEQCAKLLCQNYLENESNITLASKAVLKEIIESDNLNECNFVSIPDKNNWHRRFFPEYVCEKYINSCSNLDKEGGTYYLTGDIINSTNISCINIKESNIILDCRGHIIDGNQRGIFAKDVNNITIKNCIISRCSNALYLVDVTNSKIFNLTFRNNGRGIFLDNSDNCSIEKVKITNCTYVGIHFSNIYNSEIKDSYMSNCFKAIILEPAREFRMKTHNKIHNNYIYNNSWGMVFSTAFVYHTGDIIYGNIFNNTNNVDTLCPADWIGVSESWNTTKEKGGGNYWGNPNGTGYSDTCEDLDKDGFCDKEYILTSENIDYLPLSKEYLAKKSE